MTKLDKLTLRDVKNSDQNIGLMDPADVAQEIVNSQEK